jgi:hypothetical protein
LLAGAGPPKASDFHSVQINPSSVHLCRIYIFLYMTKKKETIILKEAGEMESQINM